MSVRLPGTPLSWLDKEIAEAEAETLSFQCSEARKSGLYPFHVAAHLIARAAGSFVSAEKIRDRLIFAARDRSLPAYELEQTVGWDGDMPIVSCLEIHWDDLNKWLENNEPRIDYKFPKPDTPAAATSQSVKRGISKSAVINAFEGLRFNRDQWSKYLADLNSAPWLKDCWVSPPGAKGSRISRTWNPVLIAVALYGKEITVRKLDAVFVGLNDWADEWQEASASLREIPHIIPDRYRTPARKAA